MRLFILVLLYTFTFSVYAQLEIAGKVIDAETNEPLIGANIYLLTDFSIGTVSNIEGDFELVIPQKALSDSLLISFIGYKENILAVREVKSIIALEPKETQMMAVQVTAEPLIAEEFKFTKVDKIEIYTNPASKADPLLAVNSMPSSTTTDESATISLRGSSPLETGIFLNNVPVYDVVRYAQLNGIGMFSLFNTSLIQKVTVFPGNPPLEFGNSTSGVVAIETDDNDLKANTNSMILSPANVGFQRNQRIGKVNLKLFGNYQPSQLLKWMNPNALERLRAFQSTDGGAYLYGNISEGVSFKVYNYLLRETYKYQFIHPSFEGDFDQGRLKAFNVTNLSWDTGKGTFSWNQGYSITNGKYAYSASDFSVSGHSLYQGISYYRAMERFQFKFGMSMDTRSAEVEGEFFTYEYALAANHPTVELNDKASVLTVDAFAYAKYYLTSKWIAGGGLRKNLNKLSDRNYLSKQINLTHIINDQWKVIAGAGQYNKLGLFENRADEVEIKSQQVSLDLFYNRQGFQSSCSIFAKSNKVSESKNEVLGFEVYVEKRLGNKWSTDLAYTYLAPSASTPYDLSYFIKTNLSYKPGYWTLSINSVMREGLTYHSVTGALFREDLDVYEPAYSETAERYADYFILNLAVSRLFPISEDFTMVMFSSINNLTNSENLRGYQYNYDYSERSAELLSQRLVYFGVQLNF